MAGYSIFDRAWLVTKALRSVEYGIEMVKGKPKGESNFP